MQIQCIAAVTVADIAVVLFGTVSLILPFLWPILAFVHKLNTIQCDFPESGTIHVQQSNVKTNHADDMDFNISRSTHTFMRLIPTCNLYNAYLV